MNEKYDIGIPASAYDHMPSPCYVLRHDALVKNLDLMEQMADEAGCEILCALKGFSFWKEFPAVGAFLSGAAASSLNEALLARRELGNDAIVHVCAPAYRKDEIGRILDCATHITFNSFAQWETHRNLVQHCNVSPGIRINPEFSTVDTDIYNPAGRYSRLGVTKNEFNPSRLHGIEGLHFHALCEQNADALEAVLERVEANFGEWIPQMKWMNFGGGHHLTRKDYDRDRFIRIIKDFRKKYPGVKVLLEPGEAVGWQTGELVTTVLDIVRNEMNIAILDASISCHMPDCLEMPYKPAILNAYEPRENPNARNIYRFGGNTCLAGDFIGDYAFERPLSVGDRVVFLDMMHYTMVKTTFFNGARHPCIGIYDDNKFNLVREFDYDMFKDRLS